MIRRDLRLPRSPQCHRGRHTPSEAPLQILLWYQFDLVVFFFLRLVKVRETVRLALEAQHVPSESRWSLGAAVGL